MKNRQLVHRVIMDREARHNNSNDIKMKGLISIRTKKSKSGY